MRKTYVLDVSIRINNMEIELDLTPQQAEELEHQTITMEHPMFRRICGVISGAYIEDEIESVFVNLIDEV